MHNFLLKIDGQSTEDLTSEVLCYILTTDGYSVYQKIFFNFIFNNNLYRDSSELGFDISTRTKFTKFGVPDILIKNESEVIIIENKFFAPYSGDNQISRYVNILTEYFTGYKKKTIFLLSIKSRIEYYNSLIKEDIKRSGVDINQVEIKNLIWEEILELFKSDNFVIQNLSNYISKKYLTNISFNKTEIEMLQKVELPIMIQKVFDLVIRVRDLLLSRGFTGMRIGQSNQYLGFTIKLKNTDVWFGYLLAAWKSPLDEKICTPIHMQIRPEWIKEDNIDNFFKYLAKIEFRHEVEQEWLKPYKVELFENPEHLLNELLDDIKKIENYRP